MAVQGQLLPTQFNAFGAQQLSSAEPKATTDKTKWGQNVQAEAQLLLRSKGRALPWHPHASVGPAERGTENCN